MSGQEESPNCTDFCRDGGTSLGHYAVAPGRIAAIRTIMEGAGPDGNRTRYSDNAAADLLYGAGFAYHEIAEAFGWTHEHGYLAVTGQAHGERRPADDQGGH